MIVFSNWRIVLMILFCVHCHVLFSQENSIYGNFFLSPFLINPAVTGASYYKSAEFSVKNQWLGFEGAPATFLLGYNYRMGKYDFYDPKGFVNKGPFEINDRVGLGFSLFRDINGPLTNTGGMISYAYHFQAGSDSRLSLGMAVTGTYYKLHADLLKPGNPSDPYLYGGNEEIFRANINLGVFYYNPVYFLGFSAAKILPDISNVNVLKKEQPSLFLMGGYKFYKDYKSFIFEPSFTTKFLKLDDFSADINMKLYIKRVNWIALSYSTVGKANFRFGVNLYKMLCAAYDFEFCISRIARYNYGTHQFSIGINLGLINIDGIRTTKKY